ncbi:MAG: carboxypeptidase-like regulatory domain-containing protein, partial [Anaerolineaceae bacterium]
MHSRAIVAALFLFAGMAFGQGGVGAISGSATDTSGAVVPGTVVTAINDETGFRRETTVGSAGEYSIVGLQPGSYTLVAERSGFKKFTTKGLTLQVDQNARIDVRLEVGVVSEVVEVSSRAAMLQTEQSSVGSVVDHQKIVEFPLNGRNFVQLGLLLPGVNTGDVGGVAGGGTSGGGISISGLRPEQNSFLLDGTTNSDQYQNSLVIRPSVDAIEEFKIQTSNYSAEFGKGAGGQINVVTRGGTNDFHGTLFEFNRNNAVQARNLFDRNPSFRTSDGRFKAPPFNQNQFGLTLGGPVRAPHYNGKDRTFFFVNYEGYRLRRGNTTLTSVPTPEMKRGDFSSLLGAALGRDAEGSAVTRNAIYDALTSRLVGGVYVRTPFASNIIPSSRFDPVALKAVNYAGLMPDPNIAGTRGANGNPVSNYFDGRTRASNYDLVSVRADHQFSSKDTVMARYSLTDSNAFAPNTFPGYGSQDNQRQMAGTIAYTHIVGAAAVNEFKFGYLRFAQYQAAENTIAGRDIVKELGVRGFTFASTPGLQGAPNFSIGGFATFGDGDGPFRPRDNTFQFIDQFSFNRGRNFFKAGGEIRRTRMA